MRFREFPSAASTYVALAVCVVIGSVGVYALFAGGGGSGFVIILFAIAAGFGAVRAMRYGMPPRFGTIVGTVDSTDSAATGDFDDPVGAMLVEQERLRRERAAPAEPRTLVDELERLDALHRSGALGDDEFARAKNAVLARGET